MNERSPDRLVWMDLEMTGLSPERDAILEIATLITDNDLNPIAGGPVLAIHQSDTILAGMDDWNKEHHAASRLLDRVRSSRITLAEAEERTLSFVRQHCAEKSSPLCGNSICQDRRFLARHMPALEHYLHYRNLDVSTVKELVRRWYPSGLQPPEKKHAHLALDDIRESVEELRFYRSHFFVPPLS